jgi:hypothetical protein
MQQSKLIPFSYGWYKCVAKLLSKISTNKKKKYIQKNVSDNSNFWQNLG